jgi:hypothetical protein
MRLTFWISLLAIGLASLLGPGAASAGTLVEFPYLPGHTPANLSGYLARPDSGWSTELGDRDYRGEGPFPAVVVLHGCIGITGHFAGIADRLSSWGYVALAVDSLGPRGISSRYGVGSLDQPFDAYAALRYLLRQDTVDDPGEWVELRTRRWSPPPVPRRNRERQHLGYCPRIDPNCRAASRRLRPSICTAYRTLP